ncbi:MAG: GNAT family N-acetyltransferase [Eubacteriales bacterium]|nr:GNAT family N-acetyltransferase [Eubacteriales bacterium]
METVYLFREAAPDEVSQVFSLILKRMRWMDEKGIRQWNVTRYNEAYPQSYYAKRQRQRELFVLTNPQTDEVIGAAVLKQSDERWTDDAPAMYLHNFVTKVGSHGAGNTFLNCAEAYAASMGKVYIRLDSAEGNRALGRYYEEHGYLSAGTCEEGLYRGILRQKLLKTTDS